MSEPTTRSKNVRTKYVKVAVNAGRPNFMTFTYDVPPDREVEPGEVVHVPWGRRRLQGVVVDGPIDMPGYAGETRPLEQAVEDAPVIPAHRRELAAWIADYYFAPQWESYALMLPPGAGERPRTAIVRGPGETPDALSERQQAILDLLSDEPADLDQLRDATGRRGFDPALQALVRRGLAERRYTLDRPRGRPRVAEVLRLAVEPQVALVSVDAMTGRRSSRRARAISALLDADEALPFAAVAKIARGAPAVETLISDGLLTREGGDHVRLIVDEERARDEVRLLVRTREQTAAAALLERLVATPEHELPVAGLARDFGTEARKAVNALEALAVVRIEEVLDRRDPLRDLQLVQREAAQLVREQQTAADAIASAIDRADGAGMLLQGVTGSGKTEVYLAALDHAVAQGKRAIVLVPEIALTPQTVRRFSERFPGRVGVLHSGLSLGEAYDEWHAIEGGAYDVVVGSRSAIFAPQPDLGLIVIDEAHEWTYKQQDPAPRYDSRTVAMQISAVSGAVTVFGSATPDAERWYAGAEGDLELLELPSRLRVVAQPDGAQQVWAQAELPEVEVIDVRGATSLFSDELIEALAETLDRDEQAILFLNRRGYAGFMLCANGHSPACGSCDVSLTLHDPPGRLVCHQCNRSRPRPRECRECGATLRQSRAGTQRVVSEVLRHFPAARVERWDRDTARRLEHHEEILGRFTRQEADVLVGTQMVAKGLDLPLVTFVGVVLADHGLREGDFRSRERTFQLLEQVGGRAGRAERDGRVIIQTLAPDDPAIEFAAAHDVEGFYEQELSWRALHGYPPFGKLVRLLFAHERGGYAAEEATRVHKELSTIASGLPDVEVMGPSRPQIARVRGRHRWSLLLRGTEPTELLRQIELPPGWAVDVDPMIVS
jgi:primosomal protein N' (replication factor Y)